MAEVTASAVKSLREKTGAGMVDCKNALVEANGDEAQAIEILRKKGMATAGKKAGRVTAEGAVGSYIHMGGKVGVLVDQPFVKDPSKTIGELVAEKIGSIKENITIRRFTRYKMGEGIEKKIDDFAAEVASMVG
jgi:translation elongation factor EF-Ts